MTWVDLPRCKEQNLTVSFRVDSIVCVEDVYGTNGKKLDFCCVYLYGCDKGFSISLSREDALRLINEALLKDSMDKELRSCPSS